MIGRVLSHYQILEMLGAGGMGEVFLAEDDRLGRKLALKILPAQYMKEPNRIQRFEHEARTASSLNHPNILTIYEIGHEDGLHFIATEFVEGETLRDRLSSRRLSVEESIDIAIQTASALSAAHKAGIAHRDIKPDNLMLRPDGYIKVLDFGIAKLTEEPAFAEAGVGTRSMFETQPGLVMGTVAYMSPEQARGFKVDARTDIFSLGVVLYEMLSGQRPFTGRTTSDILASLLVVEPTRLSKHLPTIPFELEQIVNRMIAKEREERYQNAQDVLQDLKELKTKLSFQTGDRPSLFIEDDDIPAELFVEPASLCSEKTAFSAPYEASSSGVSYETNRGPLRLPEFAPVVAAGTPDPKQEPKRSLFPLILALLAAVGIAAAGFQFFLGPSKIDTIAVLPFTNITGDEDAEYLSDGVTEGVINSLSQLPELGVSARNSVIRYKGREGDARVLGPELNVKAILFGRIDRRGSNLTINAELVDTRNGRQIWGERYVRRAEDLVIVQEEITRSITDKLQIRLSDETAQKMARLRPKNPEAYDLYLKGRYFWNQGTLEDRRKADEYFEASFAKDPTYSLAAAGCAACHAINTDGLPPREGMKKARLVAEIALEKNNKLSDAHLTLAQVYLRYDWDFVAAEREFRRAIDLEPKNAAAHLRYAEFLTLMGRRKDAGDQLEKARRLDPRSPAVNQGFGELAYYEKNYRDAVKHLNETLLLDDDFAPAHTGLSLAYEQQGLTQDSVLEFIRARSLMREKPERLASLKNAFTDQGREAFWRTYLAQLRNRTRERFIPSSAIAAVQVRLGDHQAALASLRKAVDERDGGLVELKVEPAFDPLRNNPKFDEVLRRVGLSH
jgi:serine/threonine protein kinase/tetratricopeptide (TPR) repeat protein